ncbi:SusC/RagA family TonB-linked outer membrane protein [Sphingobacterium anhuiense]|uniref:SusC/RagA family TonB-linked outer membrane protein n=1 Tax=Sphingobacterium anhuiense TaxID=493780 RepID=A0ABW5YY04_9SPHI
MDYFYFKQGGRHRWISPHSMLVMKITTFLLLIGCLHANADTYGQKVTLSERNISLERVISILKQQTDYDFLYGTDLKADVRKVNIEAKNQELSMVLNHLFGDQSFTYTISDKTVVINSKKYSNDDTEQQRTVQGKVLDENRKPLQSATVSVEGTSQRTQTDIFGMFTLENVIKNATIRITYMGYDTRKIKISDVEAFLDVIMRQSENTLEEANVVSTGYYTIPKERATGSFEYVNNELFNRNVGPDVIGRLKGVTTGTTFDTKTEYYFPMKESSNTIAGTRKITPLNTFTMRGISTLDKSTTFNAGTPGIFPLIILDNFPYEGDINQLNPNDVESVTLLKDAAAASIWGTRSANGVIVITTKKGKLDQPMRISFNSNVTIRERLNLFYTPVMSSSDFIDIEKVNFDRGVYNNPLANFYSTVSPVVDLLAKQRALPQNDIAGRAAIDVEIDAYRNYDSRKDISKYLYRKGILQQYSMNLNGGGRQFSYYISGGYDHNVGNEVNVYNTRKNLRNAMTLRPFKNLEVNSNLYYNNTLYHSPTIFDGNPQRVIEHLPNQPYVRLADEQGNPLEVINPQFFGANLKHGYRKTVGNGRLLDWTYYPLNDINTNYSESDAHEILLNLNASYKLPFGFATQINYQYSKNSEITTRFVDRNSYYMRDYINRFALYDEDDINTPVTFQVPIGDGIEQQNINRVSYMLRGQLNFDRTFKDKHQVNALIGAERSEARIFGPPYYSLLGYNADPMSFTPITYDTNLPTLNGLSSEKIQRVLNIQPSYFNRTTSIFMNAAYNFSKRYFLTISGRNDAGNIFGMEASQRIKPTWSFGTAWNLSEEAFFHRNVLELLKFRATFGYLGNVNNSVSAYPTIVYVNKPNEITGRTYATVSSPPNPGLLPERSGILNLGVDFAFKNNRLSGTIEWFNKNSNQLIAPTPVPISSGFQQLFYNSGSLNTRGIEMNLKSVNVQYKQFKWITDFLLSYSKTIVTKYLLSMSEDSFWYVPTSGSNIRSTYREGYAPFNLWTYKFAGLDPQTGDPLGYDTNGNLTKNYAEILNSSKLKDLDDYGSIFPAYFGTFRNTFTWKSISLSANIFYKFKFKIIKPSPFNTYGLTSPETLPTAEYANRWQKPGDEKITNVPSMVFPGDALRDEFYAKSSARVISGDHIRLEDIRVDYRFPNMNKLFRSLQLYCNVNNLGIIWRANRFGIDPDRFLAPPTPKAITIGVNATF